MYTFLTCIAVLFAVMVAEVFFGGPAIMQNLYERADKLRYRGYLTLLVLAPLSIVATFFALGTVAGLYFGFVAAWWDVSTMFTLIFLLGIVSSFFSFLGDLGSLARSRITGKQRGSAGEVRTLTSIVFLSGMYGSLVGVLLKVNGLAPF